MPRKEGTGEQILNPVLSECEQVLVVLDDRGPHTMNEGNIG